MKTGEELAWHYRAGRRLRLPQPHRHVRPGDAGGHGLRHAGRRLSGDRAASTSCSAGVTGVLDDDLRAAALAALDLPRERRPRARGRVVLGTRDPAVRRPSAPVRWLNSASPKARTRASAGCAACGMRLVLAVRVALRDPARERLPAGGRAGRRALAAGVRAARRRHRPCAADRRRASRCWWSNSSTPASKRRSTASGSTRTGWPSARRTWAARPCWSRS